MKNILVGIDFEENYHKLIQKAVELAKKFNSRIWLLHVSAPDPDFVGYEVGPQYIRNSRAEELKREHRELDLLAEGLKDEGIVADSLLIQGSTTEEIIEKSLELKIDLIIAGYQEKGFLYNAIFGSTATEIIKKSEIPVLVVPLGDSG